MATAVIQRSAGRLPSVAFRPIPPDVRRLSAPRPREPRPSTSIALSVSAAALTLQLRSLATIEGEDAKITGGTRSLNRRVLALNLAGRLDTR